MEIYDYKNILFDVDSIKRAKTEKEKDYNLMKIAEIAGRAIREEEPQSLKYIKDAFIEETKDQVVKYNLNIKNKEQMEELASEFSTDWVLTNWKCYDLLANLDNAGWTFSDLCERYGQRKFTPQACNSVLSMWIEDNMQEWFDIKKWEE